MFQPDVFIKNLRKLRKQRGLSQGDLARELFVSTQAISKWERGEALPDIAHICLLSELFGVSMDHLLGNTAQEESALIAVDGGGTKTEFVLMSFQGALLKRLVLPGSNPNLYGMEHACTVLKSGIDALLQEGARVQGIYIGGSGIGVGGNDRKTCAALKAAYPHVQIFCDSDIRNVLACSEDPDNSIAVICGTGCVVYACNEGKLIRLGGSGYLLDKQGSGYDLGREALFAALEHRDGTGPDTRLTEMVEKRLGGAVWDHLHELYKKESAYIASFAPLVLESYALGDAVALQIVQVNCRRLAHLIRVACQKAPKAKTVLLSGSLFSKSEIFLGELSAMLDETVHLRLLTKPQIWGACLQCARLCGLEPPAEELFMSQYQIVASER